MSSLKKNILANFFGSFWALFAGLAFVPIYLRLLGVEAYGLIGIFFVIQGVLAIMDLGLGATATREIARLSTSTNKIAEMLNFVRTLEVVYCSIAILIGLTLALLAPMIIHNWIMPSKLTQDDLIEVIWIMALVIAIQWPISFYSGVLTGLQKMVLLNGINIGISIFRGLGSVIILWLVSPTISAYFLWQVLASALNLIIVIYFAWETLPRYSEPIKFQFDHLIRTWRFSAGIAGVMILSTLLTQLDKIILSSKLSLEIFSYYTVATLPQMVLLRLVGPVFAGVTPKFTELVSRGSKNELIELYHNMSQVVSILIFPPACIVMFFSYELMLIWTQNPEIAKNTYSIAGILAASMIMSCSMYIPYSLQLAHGWTRLSFVTNLISVIFLGPLLLFMIEQYGAIGAAHTHLILNAGYFLVSTHFMHHRLLPGEKWSWYWFDICLPFLVSFLVVGLFWSAFEYLALNDLSEFVIFLYMSMAGFVALIATVMVTRTGRQYVFNKLQMTLISKYLR